MSQQPAKAHYFDIQAIIEVIKDLTAVFTFLKYSYKFFSYLYANQQVVQKLFFVPAIFVNTPLRLVCYTIIYKHLREREDSSGCVPFWHWLITFKEYCLDIIYGKSPFKCEIKITLPRHPRFPISEDIKIVRMTSFPYNFVEYLLTILKHFAQKVNHLFFL